MEEKVEAIMKQIDDAGSSMSHSSWIEFLGNIISECSVREDAAKEEAQDYF